MSDTANVNDVEVQQPVTVEDRLPEFEADFIFEQRADAKAFFISIMGCRPPNRSRKATIIFDGQMKLACCLGKLRTLLPPGSWTMRLTTVHLEPYQLTELEPLAH